MNYLQPERLDRLAREYALGTLAGRARRRFERLLRESPQAARAVTGWQERFRVLADGVPAMQPSEAVWQQLQARLFDDAASPAGRRASAPRRGGWGAWLGSALAGVLAGTLVGVVVLRTQPELAGLAGLEERRDALPASYVGLLVDGSGKPTVLASSRRHGRQITVKMLQPLAVPAGQSARLWGLPKDGGAPFLVGTLPAPGAAGSSDIALADTAEKLFFNTTQLAVSLEPAAGPAPARPSGPFVLQGHCVKLW